MFWVRRATRSMDRLKKEIEEAKAHACETVGTSFSADRVPPDGESLNCTDPVWCNILQPFFHF